GSRSLAWGILLTIPKVLTQLLEKPNIGAEASFPGFAWERREALPRDGHRTRVTFPKGRELHAKTSLLQGSSIRELPDVLQSSPGAKLRGRGTSAGIVAAHRLAADRQPGERIRRAAAGAGRARRASNRGRTAVAGAGSTQCDRNGFAEAGVPCPDGRA